GGEGEEAGGAVVGVAADGEVGAVGGHGAGVVAGALDLVVGVAAGGVVAVVEHAFDGEPFGDEPLGDHVGGDVVLEAGPAFVEVHGGPGVAGLAGRGFRAALGP